MKSKVIKAVLSKKISEWLETITDGTVRELARDHCFVTGGSIVSMLLKEKPKDYDVYFTNKETVVAIANYYVNKFRELNPKIANIFVKSKDDRVKIFIGSFGIAAEEGSMPTEPIADVLEKADSLPADLLELEDNKEKYRPVFLSANAITLSNSIQLVLRFYGQPEEVHKNYDFVHCTNYWVNDTNLIVLNPKALECILTKELVYQGSKYPLCSVIRTRKFLSRGWTINAGQYIKMLFQVSELNLKDLNVLEDQLVGVDSSYFTQLIEQLKEQQSKNPEFNVSSTYIATIIDRIF